MANKCNGVIPRGSKDRHLPRPPAWVPERMGSGTGVTELLHGGSFGLGGISLSKKMLKCEPIPAGGYCRCRYCLDEAPWLALNEYLIEEHVQPLPHFRCPLTPCENLLSTRVLRRRAGLTCSKVLALPNFACQCDCIVADNGIILGETRRPRHIFVHIGKSCRSLAIFADKLLSHLDEECRFILFTAGTDRFTPLDTFRKGRVRTPWQKVFANPRILAWWTENRSPSLKEDSLRALPLGMVSPDLPMLLIGDGEKHSSQVSTQFGCHNMLPTWTNAFFNWSRSNEDIRRRPARRIQKIFEEGPPIIAPRDTFRQMELAAQRLTQEIGKSGGGVPPKSSRADRIRKKNIESRVDQGHQGNGES